MSRKKKQRKVAVPEEILAEGSGPVAAPETGDVEALAAAASEALADVPPPEMASPEVALAEPPPEVEAVEATDAVEPSPDAVEPSPDAVEAAAELPADMPAELSAEAAEPVAEAAAVEGASAEGLEEISDEEAAELGAVLPTSAASMDAVQLKYLVEALVFASDKPITVQRLRQLTRVSDTRRLEQSLVDLADDYKDRGIVLQQVSGGYQFRTRTQFSAWVQQLIAGRPVRLSRAQLETLAIVAYRQPITRPEIDEIRGVDSSATLKLLLDRTLIRILGKKEEVGRPMLYGTTKEFLDFFSLGDLRELPTLREYSELTDESRRVMTDELGIDPDAPIMDTTASSSDDEMVDAEPAPMSIEDMVASYNTSMDTSAEPVGDDSSSQDVAVASDEMASDSMASDSMASDSMASDEMASDDMTSAEMTSAEVASDEVAAAAELLADDASHVVSAEASAEVVVEVSAEVATVATDDVASDVMIAEVAAEVVADESSTAGVFVTHAHVAIGLAEDDEEMQSEEVSDTDAQIASTLDALAARRMRDDSDDAGIADSEAAELADTEDPAQAGEPDSTTD